MAARALAMKRLAAVIAITLLLVSLPAAQAGAATFRGKTGQGYAMRVDIDDASARVTRVSVAWRARCARPGFRYRLRSYFLPPLDSDTGGAFRDAGRFRVRTRNGRFVALIRISIRGTLTRPAAGGVPAGARGSLSARVRMTRRGRTIDHCRLRSTRWRVG